MLGHKLRRAASMSLEPVILADGYLESANINTLGLPSTIKAGDLLVVMDHAADSGSNPTPAAVTPFGFTNHVNIDIKPLVASNLPRRLMLHSKIADGSEASATISVMNKPNFGEALVAVFRPKNPVIGSVIYSGANQAASDGALPSQTVEAYNSLGLSTISLAFGRSGNQGASPSLNGDEDGFVGETSPARLAYRIDNGPIGAVSYTAVVQDGGFGNILASAYIELKK